MTGASAVSSMLCMSMDASAAPTDAHSGLRGDFTDEHVKKSKKQQILPAALLVKTVLRILFVDFVMISLFAIMVGLVLLHKIHDEYLYPQLRLMIFEEAGREFTDTTYYHRYCTGEDSTATTVEELVVTDDFTAKEAMEHQLTHGVSVYRNLLSNNTAFELREWILEQNKIRGEEVPVISNWKRYSFFLDNSMHPALQSFWKELAANKRFMDGLEAVMGPDPAIVEFQAITASYGSKDQHDHHDVVPEGSPTTYARSFFPTYSLFIPLQDTTYDMGATHICPGSHLCSSGPKEYCPTHNVPMSGGNKTHDGYWPTGWGALMNQQTSHKGMAFTSVGDLSDRVVLIPTFAPRPNFKKLETRQIGRGGAHGLRWNLWGHTISDFVHSDERMTEPQKTLRSLGFIKGNGWNFLTTASMRIANHEMESRNEDLYDWLDEGGSFWFLPSSWQGFFGEISDINDWHAYLLGTLKKAERETMRISAIAFATIALVLALWDFVLRTLSVERSRGSSLARGLKRMLVACGVVVLVAAITLTTISGSNWAKAIKAKKAYCIPWTPIDNPPRSTIPYRTDVLFTEHYASDYWASYSKLIDFAHPGNRHWKDTTRRYAAGYAALSPSLKESFCGSLLDWERLDRRFLKQDGERYWNRVVDEDELRRFCHRELSMAFDPLVESLLLQLDALKSETRYGWWRDMSIHRKVMPGYLQQWENKLLPGSTRTEKTNKENARTEATKAMFATFGPSSFRQKSFQERKRGLNDFKLPNHRRRPLPPLPVPKEPVPGAWLQEGDRVDVSYECSGEESSSAIISAALPNEATYDIEYENGEKGRSLPLKCLRRPEGG